MPPGFSHPARVAERIATLDRVSGGRVEFGTGESSSRMELEGIGVDAATKRQGYLEAVEQTCNMLAMTPYPGYEGEFFSMPCRNVVPKPAQKPHPPLWVAGKPDLAAHYGMGCLGFSVVGGRQAKIMVDEYYSTLSEECVPIGHAVNANIAVVAMLHCHEDSAVARRNGEHLRFFSYTLAKYYLQGPATPGRSNAWEEFLAVKDQLPDRADSPTSAIGTPEQVREHMRALDAAGIDQVLLLHHAGRLDHDANCRSLELFAREVMPEFVEGEDEREKAKAERLAPAIERALARKEWMPMPDEIEPVDSYHRFSHAPTDRDRELQGTSDDTVGALGADPVPSAE
jgi:alkanesulfonate monooxygenase SsuD/methylene tetrahydromethanopterin reductase-like flavin-dependent oxidoreductase (luciferase family)